MSDHISAKQMDEMLEASEKHTEEVHKYWKDYPVESSVERFNASYPVGSAIRIRNGIFVEQKAYINANPRHACFSGSEDGQIKNYFFNIDVFGTLNLIA